MIKDFCCEDCHESDGACGYCLVVGEKKTFNKDTMIHLGYVALHLIQMILIVRM